MKDYPLIGSYNQMILRERLEWKTGQVSTHGHDILLQVDPFNRQWKPFRKRGIKHRDRVLIKPSSEYEFPEMIGPGCIVNIWFTYSGYRARRIFRYYSSWEARKKVRIQIYFDNEKEPNVDSPLGDFFGVGFGKYREYQSKYLEETSGGNVCRFPMPFNKNARVVIKNTSPDKEIEAFYGAITYRQYNEAPVEKPYYFHCRYREEHPTIPEVPYKLFDAKGEGFYIGCVLNQENVRRRDGYHFLEGNTKIYVDGEVEPSLEYTGTEDLFQGAWYYIAGPFSAAYSGCTLHSWKKAGIIRFLRGYTRKNKVSQYRFHELDAIPFQKSILVFTHHGEFDEILTNQSSVTYFYAKKPVETNWKPLAKGDFPDEGYYEEH
ncbi:MAG: glycoside hydrolase family 172 protein [Candidatus Hodarchaeales archaeon]